MKTNEELIAIFDDICERMLGVTRTIATELDNRTDEYKRGYRDGLAQGIFDEEMNNSIRRGEHATEPTLSHGKL